MGSVTVKINKDVARSLLRSTEVQGDLQERADRIAASAGPGFVAEVEVGANRARGVVYTSDIDSMIAEAQDRSLTRALDAGR